MATYTGDVLSQNSPQPGATGDGGGLKRLRYPVTLSAAPTTSDTINFGYAPKGFRVYGASLKASDMDTNGSPTITLNVGDAGSATRIFSATNIAQTGTYTDVPQNGIIDYQYTADTMITGTAQANAATGAAGTLVLILVGVFDPTVNS